MGAHVWRVLGRAAAPTHHRAGLGVARQAREGLESRQPKQSGSTGGKELASMCCQVLHPTAPDGDHMEAEVKVQQMNLIL